MPSPADGAPRTGRTPTLFLALGSLIGLALAATSLFPEPSRPPAASLPDGTSSRPADAAPAPDAVATVNGVPISRADYVRALEAMSRDRRDASDTDDRKRILDRLIDEELLLQRGVELGLVRRDAKVRNDVVAAVIDTAVGDAASSEPTADEVAAFYRDNAWFFAAPGRMRARDVFVKVATADDEPAARKRADEITARLRAGEDFATVARAGDEPAAPLPDAMLPPAKIVEYLGPTASRGALALSPGQVADPARSSDGFHVVLVVERDQGDVPPLDEVESLVRSEIRRRRGEDSLRAYLDGLRAKASVRVSEKLP
ncbi:MAG: peptidyl-prolyl cis-trans isomerase [Alphaproteobacteria bacterium]